MAFIELTKVDGLRLWLVPSAIIGFYDDGVGTMLCLSTGAAFGVSQSPKEIMERIEQTLTEVVGEPGLQGS